MNDNMDFTMKFEHKKDEEKMDEKEVVNFVYEALKEKGISCTVVNARFVKPIDENMVRYLAKNHDLIVPMEENVASGGLSEKVITLVEQEKLPIEVLPITIPDEYVEHGNVDILKQEIGISTSAVLEKIEKELEAK